MNAFQFHKPVRRLAQWLGERDLLVLLTLLLAALAAWAFVAIADVVREGWTQSIDERLVFAARRPDDPTKLVGPDWLTEVARDMTALGGFAVLGLVTGAVAGYLLIARMYHAMWLVLGATTGGLVLSSLLKVAVDRPRPNLVPALSYVATTSFPSGHSMLSAVVYLTLGALLASLAHRKRLKFYFLSLAVLLTVLVGVSRVYMGVHYPTDVLAGWSAGLAWAILCWWAARYLRGRGEVETFPDEPDCDGA